MRNAIADQALDIVQKVIDQALAGDIQAAKLVLERISPSLRSIEHIGLTADTLPRMNIEAGASSQVIDGETIQDSDDIAPDTLETSDK